MVVLSAPRHFDMMVQFSKLLTEVPVGPRIEFGVCHGQTLEYIANHNDITYGVDSFEGMGVPTEHDIEPSGVSQYPRGRLRVDYGVVYRKFKGNPNVILIKGWVPQVLSELPKETYSFAHIDMDHYQPTVDAIDWLWTRMRPGGILCCDDWFPGKMILASRAIGEAIINRRPLDGEIERKCYWKF